MPDGSPPAGRDDVRQDSEHWELVDSTDDTVTDRGVGPEGQIVVAVAVGVTPRPSPHPGRKRPMMSGSIPGTRQVTTISR
ncbi:MAG: hypothetical protein V5A18_10665 [Haloarculaceae archaeon]